MNLVSVSINLFTWKINPDKEIIYWAFDRTNKSQVILEIFYKKRFGLKLQGSVCVTEKWQFAYS